jgi:hypothetical protein
MKGTSKHYGFGMAAALAALFCVPCLLAPLLIAAGLGSGLLLVSSWFAPLVILLALLSLVGFYLSFRAHKNVVPLLLALGAAGLLYYGGYMLYRPSVGYAGIGVLMIAMGFDWVLRRRCSAACALPRKDAERAR